MKSLLILLLVLSFGSANAVNLDSLPQPIRDSLLIAQSKMILSVEAPKAILDPIPPVIERRELFYVVAFHYTDNGKRPYNNEPTCLVFNPEKGLPVSLSWDNSRNIFYLQYRYDQPYMKELQNQREAVAERARQDAQLQKAAQQKSSLPDSTTMKAKTL